MIVKIVNPLAKIYCQVSKCGSFMYRTTKGPKDQIKPANKTTGMAIFSFLSSIMKFYLMGIKLDYNKIDVYLKIFEFDPIGE